MNGAAERPSRARSSGFGVSETQRLLVHVLIPTPSPQIVAVYVVTMICVFDVSRIVSNHYFPLCSAALALLLSPRHSLLFSTLICSASPRMLPFLYSFVLILPIAAMF